MKCVGAAASRTWADFSASLFVSINLIMASLTLPGYRPTSRLMSIRRRLQPHGKVFATETMQTLYTRPISCRYGYERTRTVPLRQIDCLYKVATAQSHRVPLVSDSKKTTVQSHTKTIVRDTYETPKLTEFGHVSALTQAGSMAGTEMIVMGMAVGQRML